QFEAPSGTARSSQVSRSARTSGEAFSFRVSDAEVCWISRWRMPTSKSASSGRPPSTSAVTRWMPRGRGSKVILRWTHTSAGHPEPEVGGDRFDLDRDPLELDLGPAGMLEEPDTVAEEDRLDVHQDLVELAQLEAAAGDLGAEHTDVLIPRRVTRRGDRPAEVVDELDVRRRLRGRVVGDDELGTVPGAAEGPFLLLVATVGIVPAPGAPADQERSDPRRQRRRPFVIAVH